MKKPLLIIALCLFAFAAKSQTDADLDKELLAPIKPAIDSNVIFTAVMNMPYFPGGNERFDKYITQNAKYHQDASVGAQFVVEKDGSLSHITIIRSANAEADAECIRLLQNCPKWKPGMQNKELVRVMHTAFVTFKQD